MVISIDSVLNKHLGKLLNVIPGVRTFYLTRQKMDFREGAITAGNSAQAGSSSPNPKMTLLLVFNIFRNSTFYTNVDYVPSFILCNLVVGGSTGILAAKSAILTLPAWFGSNL